MKQEQVIELCNKVGLSAYSRDGEFSIAVIAGCGAEVCTDEIVKLISLVEQATLERAAKECTRWIFVDSAAEAIRNLAKEQP